MFSTFLPFRPYRIANHTKCLHFSEYFCNICIPGGKLKSGALSRFMKIFGVYFSFIQAFIITRSHPRMSPGWFDVIVNQSLSLKPTRTIKSYY